MIVMESKKLCGLLLVLCIVFASVHEGEAGFFSKVFKKVKKTIGKVAGKVSKFVNRGLPYVSSIGGSVSSGLNTIGTIASMINGALNGKRQVQEIRFLEQAQTVQQQVAQVQDQAIQALASGNNEALQNALRQLQTSTSTIPKIRFSLDNVLSNQLKMKALAGQTFDHLNIVVGTTAGERQEALQLQGLTALSQLDELSRLQHSQTITGLNGLDKRLTSTHTTVGKIDTKLDVAHEKLDASLAGLYGIDVKLTETQKTVDDINTKVDISNIKLDSLKTMAGDILQNVKEINVSIIRTVISTSRATNFAIGKLEQTLNSHVQNIGIWIDDLSDELSDAVEYVDEQLEGLRTELRSGFSKVFQGLLEQDTRPARECYRRVKERLLEQGRSGKTNLMLLINPQHALSNEDLKHNLINLQNELTDRDHGIDSCWRRLRAVYDPAKGPGNPRDLFEKLHSKFLTEFREVDTWKQPLAVSALKSMNLMRDQLLIQLTDLFTWQSIVVIGQAVTNTVENCTALISDPEIFFNLQKLMMRYSHDTTVIYESFNRRFSLCKVSPTYLEAIEKRRLQCDGELYELGSEEDVEEYEKRKGFSAGTNCTYLCLDSSMVLSSLICGPNGQWTSDEETVQNQMVQCNQATTGLAEFKETLANMSTRMDNIENFLQKLTVEISALKESLKGDEKHTNLLRDCAEIKEANQSAISGVYRIKLFDRCEVAPHGVPCTVDVYCDMTTEGGGWTVFQRRMDGSVNFRVGWDLYQRGFGDLNGEHWLGNDIIYLMTNRGIQYQLLVDLKEWEQNCHLKALYSNFQLVSRNTYTLKLGQFLTGPAAGDGMKSSDGKGHDISIDRTDFSTIDRDNDIADKHHCAQMYNGGWWYKACHWANLNGLYSHTPCVAKRGQYIHWHTAKYDQATRGHPHDYSMQRTEMKLRPTNFRFRNSGQNNWCSSMSTKKC